MQQWNTKLKKVKFEDKEILQLETCHNLITNGHPNPEQDIEYNPQMEIIMTILMTYINIKVTIEVDNFGRKYTMEKGLKKYKERGSTASEKITRSNIPMHLLPPNRNFKINNRIETK